MIIWGAYLTYSALKKNNNNNFLKKFAIPRRLLNVDFL